MFEEDFLMADCWQICVNMQVLFMELKWVSSLMYKMKVAVLSYIMVYCSNY